MRKTRKLQKRRDRRKAKASQWRRQGKVRMGVVGHGQNGGGHRVGGLDPLSKDSLEALFRRNGVELSPLVPEPIRKRAKSVTTKVIASK